ncbi:hypothetical protein DSOL_4704 [Desulfosporosinus metallidurans]|uniref:Uncharacterized protein n=1 Tax=Desulfosporosinus metallidurans TaxID=1888891 RepID=A0A1Q8QIE2_9FIRM|nr:hypothetical protein DSOL_4704 [Desulfosporosinus metallidurans]
MRERFLFETTKTTLLGGSNSSNPALAQLIAMLKLPNESKLYLARHQQVTETESFSIG